MTAKSLYHSGGGTPPRGLNVAHEVVKRVGRRAYRYRVESYRDAETRKVRSRWSYLGPVVVDVAAGEQAVRVPRRPSAETRERLLDAFVRLAERTPYRELTASAVAEEAGVAHGTFYRYFKDKRDVFGAAVHRVREEFDRAEPSFEGPSRSREEERRRLSAWIDAIFARTTAWPGLSRAWYEALEEDAELQTQLKTRRKRRIDVLAAYLARLMEAGIVATTDAGPLAAALSALLETTARAAIGEGRPIGTSEAVGVKAVFDRAIFAAA